MVSLRNRQGHLFNPAAAKLRETLEVKAQASSEVTFHTTTDSRYFPGTVAMVNSLRLTGHQGELVVLDLGLTSSQLKSLEQHARIVDGRGLLREHPLKMFAALREIHGVVAFIDSDMIVTGSLEPALVRASQGDICLHPDHPGQRERHVPEWQEQFKLAAPLRKRTYMNSGFVALSIDHWPEFVKRWWTACQTLSDFSGDQEALNALLMSEVPEGRVGELPADDQVHPDGLVLVKIVDAKTLECRFGATKPTILHYSLGPKAWERSGLWRVRLDAYVRLLPRLWFADDLTIQLPSNEVPYWMRGTSGPPTLSLRFIDLSHRGIARGIRTLPWRLRRRIVGLRSRLQKMPF